MEFRIANLADTEQVSALWAYCFEPKEDPFFQYYFENCYEPDNTMVGLEKGQILSTVHLRQYDLQVRNHILPTSYMVGVATHPAARRGGVGGQLLLASLEELRRRQQGVTILMPSKAAYYQQYGWELYCHQWVQTMSLENLRPLTDRTMHFGLINHVEQWSWLAPVYEEYTKNLSGFAVRGEKEWRRLLESLFAEGVNIALVKDEADKIEGYMVYRLGQAEIMVSELVYTSRRAQKALLNYIYNHRSQGDSIRWNEGFHDAGFRLHPDGKTGHMTMPFMMARIVDVEMALRQVGVHSFFDSMEDASTFLAASGQSAQDIETVFTMAVDDEFCKWNQGVYRVEITFDGQVKATRINDDPNSMLVDVSMDIGALSQLIMGAMSVDELVFEGRLAVGEDMEQVLAAYYPKERCYINEWW